MNLRIEDRLVRYDMGQGAEAFSPMSDAVLPYHVVQGHQVHGNRIAVVDNDRLTRADLEGFDAFVTDVPGIALGARTADCVPVLLYDPVNRAVAAVHSGWKGTVLKIAASVLERMHELYGTDAANVRAVIGPSIGPDSFQIGPEVADSFAAAGFPMVEILSDCGERVPGTMQGGLHLDLWKANAWILRQAGVGRQSVLVAGIDTYTDTRFFSARREGAACGRTVNTIKLV